LGLENAEQLKTHYLRGGLFENFVVNEFIKQRFNQGKKSNLYFWQSKDKKEIDLIAENAHEQEVFEIKTSVTKQAYLFDNLLYWKKLNPENKALPTVIYGGSEDFLVQQGLFKSWRNLG
jgi:predicted AAA+ superfamily ATPase